MEAYRPIMLNLSYLVALWAIAYVSASQTPQSFLEYVVLAAASGWMLYASVLATRQRHRITAVFFGICALVPWCFYAELLYIFSNNEDVPADVFEANFVHALFIYNSFKYMFLACAFGAAFKGTYTAIKEFASSGRD